MIVRTAWRLMTATGLLVGLSGAAPVDERVAALNGVQPGQWQLRETGGPTRSICVRDPANLFQLRNRGSICTRLVIADTASSATVNYTCPGAGHGRTTIAVETPRLLRIESQGLDGGSPFALEIEGRRLGSCTNGS